MDKKKETMRMLLTRCGKCDGSTYVLHFRDESTALKSYCRCIEPMTLSLKEWRVLKNV